jgi:hypothetical protein
VAELGYEHLRRHSLRHTGLTWMADAGVPVHVLRKIARHGSITTTQRSLHPDLGTSCFRAGSVSLGVFRRPTTCGPVVTHLVTHQCVTAPAACPVL